MQISRIPGPGGLWTLAALVAVFKPRRRYGAGRIFAGSHAKGFKLGTAESASFGHSGKRLGGGGSGLLEFR